LPNYIILPTLVLPAYNLTSESLPPVLGVEVPTSCCNADFQCSLFFISSIIPHELFSRACTFCGRLLWYKNNTEYLHFINFYLQCGLHSFSFNASPNNKQHIPYKKTVVSSKLQVHSIIYLFTGVKLSFLNFISLASTRDKWPYILLSFSFSEIFMSFFILP
jgi:hypothetical protein